MLTQCSVWKHTWEKSIGKNVDWKHADEIRNKNRGLDTIKYDRKHNGQLRNNR